MKRVVITGYGILSPIGNNRKEIEDSFFNKKSGIVNIPEWSKIKGLRSQVAGTVKNIDQKIFSCNRRCKSL